MELADQTIATAAFAIGQVLHQIWIDQRRAARCCRSYPAVAVCSLYGCTVEDKDYQQQTEASRQSSVAVFESVNKSTGHCLNCYARFGLVQRDCTFRESQKAIVYSPIIDSLLEAFDALRRSPGYPSFTA
jgi:hypothetical protein